MRRPFLRNRLPAAVLRIPSIAGLLLLGALAACGGAGSGGTLQPLDAELGDGLRVRAVFAGDELVYAFVADPALRVMMTKEPPRTLPPGLLYCFGVEEGLFLDGTLVPRPAGAEVFALTAEGDARAIELSKGERKTLTQHLANVRGPIEDDALIAALRAPFARD